MKDQELRQIIQELCEMLGLKLTVDTEGKLQLRSGELYKRFVRRREHYQDLETLKKIIQK